MLPLAVSHCSNITPTIKFGRLVGVRCTMGARPPPESPQQAKVLSTFVAHVYSYLDCCVLAFLLDYSDIMDTMNITICCPRTSSTATEKQSDSWQWYCRTRTKVSQPADTTSLAHKPLQIAAFLSSAFRFVRLQQLHPVVDRRRLTLNLASDLVRHRTRSV